MKTTLHGNELITISKLNNQAMSICSDKKSAWRMAKRIFKSEKAEMNRRRS